MNIKNFFGKGITIVNGQVIGKGEKLKTQKFDERKIENAEIVDKIAIDTATIDVNISVSDSSNIEVLLCGEAQIDGNIKLNVCNVNRELKISLDFDGNCYNSNLKFEIKVPRKTFKLISAKTASADVILEEGVTARYIKVKTQSGDVESGTTFTDISISTMSGDIDLCAKAKENISVNLSSMSGDVSVKLKNVGNIKLSTISISGDIVNCYSKTSDGYSANVDISTMSGDIMIM